METQFNQLDKLELLKYKKAKNAKVTIYPNDQPEVIFLIANHNPRSTKLKTILSHPEIQKYKQENLFKLRFYAATFAGYGLHTKNMHTLTKFNDLT
jgi:hypothetical protein